MSLLDAVTTRCPAGEEKKSSWPELVGKSIEDARKVILKDMPEADIKVLPVDSVVTAEWRSNRVRILVDTPAESRMSCAAPKAPAGEEKKTSWPEVVGKSIEEAKEVILKDMPDADIVVLPAGSPVTLDFRTNRVRIFVDTVASTPHIG
ncbi:putative proteinase inhibitor [Hordeum vulgare]|nr:putative proteinase inhibitor [Hordeum vulgare]